MGGPCEATGIVVLETIKCGIFGGADSVGEAAEGSEACTRALGEVAEDGFRLTAGGPPLQDLRTSPGKLTTFHGNFHGGAFATMTTTLPPFPVAFPISATGEVDRDVRAAARTIAVESGAALHSALAALT